MDLYRRAVREEGKGDHVSWCWYRIALCHRLLEQWREAAAVLCRFETSPLRESKEASDAALLRFTALERIFHETGSPADKKALEVFIAELVKASNVPPRLIRERAIDLEKKKKYLEAAGLWEKLARPGEKGFEEAVFRTGFDLYRGGVDHWERALRFFKRHLDHVEGMKKKPAGAVGNAVGSIHFSCRILMHPRINRPQQALEISEKLESRFPGADPRFVNSILSNRIKARLGLGQLEPAEEDLNLLEARYEETPLGSGYLSNALAAMVVGFERAAEAVKKKDRKRYVALMEKAGRALMRWIDLSRVTDPEKVAAIAEKLYFLAEERKGPLELYERCLILFREVLFWRERTREAEDDLQTFHERISRCLAMTGRIDEGIRELEEYLRSGNATHAGSVQESLADLHWLKAESLPKGRGRDVSMRRANGIYTKLASGFTGLRVFNEHTWRLLHKSAECLWLLEEYGALGRFFRSYDLGGYAPKWDGNEWGFRDRFEELRRKLAGKMPQ